MPKQQKIINPTQGGLWGIMGGAFDPIHMGHLIMAQSVMYSLEADGMLFVPARSHPFKSADELSDHAARVEMVDLAIADNSRFRLEHPPENSSYTIDLIDYLQSTFPRARFFLPLGSDLIDEFESWYKFEEIEQNIKIVIASRPGYSITKKQSEILKGAERIMIPQYDISSRDIRKRVRTHMSITYMVPPEVEKYIYEKGLYGG